MKKIIFLYSGIKIKIISILTKNKIFIMNNAIIYYYSRFKEVYFLENFNITHLPSYSTFLNHTENVFIKLEIMEYEVMLSMKLNFRIN